MAYNCNYLPQIKLILIFYLMVTLRYRHLLQATLAINYRRCRCYYSEMCTIQGVRRLDDEQNRANVAG